MRTWTLLLSLALLAAVLLPDGAVAATRAQQLSDATTLRAAVDGAARKGAVDGAAAGAYRASIDQTLGVLDALDTPAKLARRDELAAALDQLAAISNRGDLSAARMPAAFHQLDANRSWFAAHPVPAPLAHVTVPGDPVVYGYYPGHGLALQPLFTWTQANQYWFAHDDASLQALIDVMAPFAVPQPGGWRSFEYLFDYGSGQAPWRSGMAEGVALQVLARAWHDTQDPADLALARQLLPGFQISTADGGLRDPSGQAWWPLYAFDPAERVLNGDLQVLISLYDYATLTGDTSARALADQGAATALAVLPSYDTGAWSLYDQRHEASLGYHDLMTLQLHQLAAKSGNPIFRTYGDRFALYRSTAPTIAPDPESSPATTFYPAPRDGFEDRATLPVQLDKESRLVLHVVDESGHVVLTERLGTFARGTVPVTWDGLIGSSPAPPASYDLSVQAIDLAGNHSAFVDAGIATAARDTTPPAIGLLRVGRAEHGRLRVRWSLRDDETPSVCLVAAIGSQHVRRCQLRLSGTLVLPLHVPRRGFTAYLQLSDTSGNHVTVRRRPV